MIDVIVGATIFTGSVVAAGVVFNESSQTLGAVQGRQAAVVLASNILSQATAYGCGAETGVDLPSGVSGASTSQPGAPSAASVYQACSFVYSGASGTAYQGNLGDPPSWSTGVSPAEPAPVQVGSSTPATYHVDYRAVWTSADTSVGSLVAAGGATGYAVSSAGNVYAWGANGSGQLGIGNSTPQSGAVEVGGPGGSGSLSNVISVAAGSTFALALTSSGTVYAWGSINGSAYPAQVSGLSPVSAIAAGGGTALAVASSSSVGGTVFAWGAGSQGQLGNGGTSNSTAPVAVGGGTCTTTLAGVVQVAEGSEDSYALTSSGSVWAWGAASAGQLGNGSTSSPSSDCPVQVTGIPSVRGLAAGQDFAGAYDASGKVYTWGAGGSGQLGDGAYAGSSTPVAVEGPGGSGSVLTGVDALAAGNAHFLAATVSGPVYAWGSNNEGQLGVTSPSQSDIPVTVQAPSGASGGLNGLSGVGAGQAVSYAIASSGTVYSWGATSGGYSATPSPVQDGGAALDVVGVPSGCPTSMSGSNTQPGGQTRTVWITWNASGVTHSYSASTFAATPSDQVLYRNATDGGLVVTGMETNGQDNTPATYPSWPSSSWVTLSVPAAAYASSASGSTSVNRYASSGQCGWFPFLPPSQSGSQPTWSYQLTYHYYTTNGSGQPVAATVTVDPTVSTQQITDCQVTVSQQGGPQLSCVPG